MLELNIYRRCEPTYYLGGQTYVFEEGTIDTAPELAEAAYYETYRQLWRTFGAYFGRVTLEEDPAPMSEEDYHHRMTEMLLGLTVLRPHINRNGTLLPNLSVITVH